MSHELLDAIMECAKRRVRVREVPRGHRVSFPFPLDGEHLIELSYESVGRGQYRMTDAGVFFTYLADHGMNHNSEAVKGALAGLQDLGFKKTGLPGEEEITAQLHLEEIGCASWDLATAMAATLRSLLNEHREGVARFETEIKNRLKPVAKAIKWKHEIHGIRFPIYVPGPNIAAVLVGSHGRTVDPAEVARRQMFPFYQLVARHLDTQYKRYALIAPDYWKVPAVKQMVKDVNTQVVQTNELQRFEKAIQGAGGEGLALAA